MCMPLSSKFLQSPLVKNWWKLINIWWRYGQSAIAYFFGPPCTIWTRYVIVAACRSICCCSSCKLLTARVAGCSDCGRANSIAVAVTMTTELYITMFYTITRNITGRIITYQVSLPRRYCGHSQVSLSSELWRIDDGLGGGVDNAGDRPQPVF